MKSRVIASGGLAALIALSGCQWTSESLTLDLAAQRHSSLIRVHVTAHAAPQVTVVVVAKYGKATIRRKLTTNKKGTATATYEVPAHAGVHVFSASANVSRTTHGSVNSATVSSTISL